MDDFMKAYVEKHPIECMFFSEFHVTQGPKITYQYPEDYFTLHNELFDEVITYIIPKPELQQRLITINTGSKKVIGCPVCLEGDHYPRNNYIFNFGLVLDGLNKSSPCIPLTKQLSKYMTELELESRFISDPETKKMIPKILMHMFIELNEKGKCSTQITPDTTLYLKVFPPTLVPPQVRDHDVPILMVRAEEFVSAEWDLTTQQIIPYIDGFRHVQKIAALADVDPHLTRTCVQDLAFYRIVELISIFQYSNTYITTPNLSRLIAEKSLREECIKYVSRPGHPHPTLYDIMKILCGLGPGVTVESLCRRHHDQLTRVNEQKLIQFGLIHELLRRINMYPVRTQQTSDSQEFYKYFTGEYNTDEICCSTGLGSRDLLARIEQDVFLNICWK